MADILGAKKIEIETAMLAAKIDRNRSFLEKSQSTQHYIYLTSSITKIHFLVIVAEQLLNFFITHPAFTITAVLHPLSLFSLSAS